MKIVKCLFVILLGTLVSLGAIAQSRKPVVGVGEITSLVQGNNPESFRAMLETAVAQTNKFELLERSRMDELLGEQALGAGGLTTGRGEIGGLGSVDYLIYGSVTKLGTKKSGFAFGDLKTGSAVAEMSVDVRVVDAHSGSIRISKAVEKSANSALALTGTDLAVVDSGSDPLGEVQRLTAEAIAGMIAMDVFPIRVINVSKGQGYVNYGPPVVENGMYLKLVEMGEGFVDPDTGEVLGADETYIGALKITDAKPKFSIGVILEGEVTKGLTAFEMSRKEGKKLRSKYKKACKKDNNCLL